MTHPSNKIKNLLRRVNRARDFPKNTCPASRHVQTMAEFMLNGGYSLLTSEPEYCAVSMLSVVESLWKARKEIARLKGLK